MTEYWWRSWHGAPMDHKWAVIASRAGVKPGVVSAVAWALLDYASQQKDRGNITGFDTETYAVYSGFPESEIIAVLQAMTDKGVIIDGRLANWEKRQPKREDDSTGRVRKHREMKRNVTHGNAPDTDTDTDKETEEEKEEEWTPTPHSKLSVAFVNISGLPEFTGGAQRWNESLSRMVEAGVDVCDIEAAYYALKRSTKKYTIASIASIENAAYTALSERNGKIKNEPLIDESIPYIGQ